LYLVMKWRSWRYDFSKLKYLVGRIFLILWSSPGCQTWTNSMSYRKAGTQRNEMSIDLQYVPQSCKKKTVSINHTVVISINCTKSQRVRARAHTHTHTRTHAHACRPEKRFTWCFVTEERTLILTISRKFFAERIVSVSRGGGGIWRPQIKTSQGVNSCNMMASNTRYNFC